MKAVELTSEQFFISLFYSPLSETKVKPNNNELTILQIDWPTVPIDRILSVKNARAWVSMDFK